MNDITLVEAAPYVCIVAGSVFALYYSTIQALWHARFRSSAPARESAFARECRLRQRWFARSAVGAAILAFAGTAGGVGVFAWSTFHPDFMEAQRAFLAMQVGSGVSLPLLFLVGVCLDRS